MCLYLNFNLFISIQFNLFNLFNSICSISICSSICSIQFNLNFNLVNLYKAWRLVSFTTFYVSVLYLKSWLHSKVWIENLLYKWNSWFYCMSIRLPIMYIIIIRTYILNVSLLFVHYMYVFMHVKCKHCAFMWMHVFQPPILTFPHAGTYLYSHASPATHGYHPLKEPTMPIWLLQRVWKENEAKEKASNEVQESDVSSSSDETDINSRDKECV